MKKFGIMRILRGVVLPAVVPFAMVVASTDSCAVEMRGNAQFLSDGNFRIGCNYWASHAGMKMWSRWDAVQVEKDLDALADNGITVLRVFPLWPDFQPITIRRGGGGKFAEWAQNDRPLSNPEGVDEEMLSRFRFLCDAAGKRGQKLVVGLITGWMSGRSFVPPAFDGRNVLVDPAARMWEVRFVRKFVRELKEHPAIAAWDLGNECNCLGEASAWESWNWLNEIASAIRLEDRSRPVVSGMHGLKSDRNAPWNMRMQGELMDVLTTHPYPLWTPDMNHEPFNSLRNGLHATAESLLYAGVSGKPCFVEEAGDMGRNVCSEARAAANVRVALCSSWAHGLGAYVWWCAFDQGHLGFPPYTWTAVECDLGLFDRDFRAKPALVEMKRFSGFLREFPHARLPPRQVDAVCLVSEREHFPAASFGAFCLAKQAGFDVVFAGAEGSLPESRFYILPSGRGYDPYSGEAYANVLAKVRLGATLLVTKGNETAMPFVRETTGNEIDYTTKDPLSTTMTLKAFPGKTIAVRAATTSRILSHESEVVGTDADGNPMMTVVKYGKGRVVFVNFAAESDAFLKGGAYWGKNMNPMYLVYREAARIAGVERAVEKPADVPNVGITEHRLDDGRTLAVVVNYDPSPVEVELSSKGRIGRVWGDGTVDGSRLSIGANDYCVLEIVPHAAMEASSDIVARWAGDIPVRALASGASTPELGAISPRSVFVEGDFARFEKVWARLERGEGVRIAVIGGSITHGALASYGAPPGSEGNRWGDRFCEGWRRAFPNARIEGINAGVGATGSDIGSYRLKHDVLVKKPDVVVVEFCVNDDNGRESGESYEGVVRQLLKAPGEIAVVLLGMVKKDGQSAQERHGEVARHYNLPFVSYRDALYPCVKSGEIKWSDISPDDVHPNFVGHAYAAALLNRYLASRYAAWKSSGRPPAPIAPLPGPLFGTRYENGDFVGMTEVKVLENKGFFPLKDICWGEGLACTNAASRLVFEVEGSTVSILYRLGCKPFSWGKIDVSIDGKNVAHGLNCFRNLGWWYTPSLLLCSGKPGRHVVEVVALSEKDDVSSGYGCHLTGILVRTSDTTQRN